MPIASTDEQVRDAEEVGDVRVGRLGVHLTRRADLRDVTAVHHGEAVAHRERLLLVVGHVEEGDPDVALQRGELVLERLAQLGVERAERLVEQEHRAVRARARGRVRRAAAGRPTAARACACAEPFEPNQRDRVADPALPVGLADPALPAQAVRDVVLDREMREQRVALEHGVDRPAVRRSACEVDAVEEDRPGGRLLEPGDEPQCRGLAASRRPEQREELARADRQVDAVDGHELAEALLETDQLDRATDSLHDARRRVSRRPGVSVCAVTAPEDTSHSTATRCSVARSAKWFSLRDYLLTRQSVEYGHGRVE